jgi:hypothetical protein
VTITRTQTDPSVRHVYTMQGADWLEWSAIDGLTVCYQPRLDGGGSFAAEWFLDYFRTHHPGRRFANALEWCSGPGFIGLTLLAQGICDRLVLADVNPQAQAAVERTLATNAQLADKTRFYLSNNLHGVPDVERFDLVVANPPYATRGNPLFTHDQRTEDPGWQIHADFFANIKRYLTAEALLCISEFCPLEASPEQDVLPSGTHQWDLRQRAPIEEWLPMIRSGGLRLREVVNATGEAPSIRLTKQFNASPIPYADWFWILVIDGSSPRRNAPAVKVPGTAHR